MEPLEIVNKLKEKFPEEIVDVSEFRGQVSVSIKKDRIIDICRYLHDDPELHFDFLSDLCGVDYLNRKPRFEVVYNLYSLSYRHRVLLKAGLPEEDTNINSVTAVWNGADWHEREAYDMYGINFKGHPDLRRILLPEDWEGYPQRKDYPLKGPAKEYKGYEEIKELHKHDEEWTIK